MSHTDIVAHYEVYALADSNDTQAQIGTIAFDLAKKKSGLDPDICQITAMPNAHPHVAHLEAFLASLRYFSKTKPADIRITCHEEIARLCDRWLKGNIDRRLIAEDFEAPKRPDLWPAIIGCLEDRFSQRLITGLNSAKTNVSPRKAEALRLLQAAQAPSQGSDSQMSGINGPDSPTDGNEISGPSGMALMTQALKQYFAGPIGQAITQAVQVQGACFTVTLKDGQIAKIDIQNA